MKTKVFIISALFLLLLARPLFPPQDQEGQASSGQEQAEPLPEPEIVPVPEPVEEVAEEPPSEGGVTGRLVDELGSPIEGVTVSAVDEGGRVVAETLTDEEGRYRFDKLVAGSYTLTVSYPGTSAPIGIQFEEKENRAPIPTGLRVSEIHDDIPGSSFIRARWDKMPDALSYRCEIRKKEDKQPLVQYEGILNNSCEFGNLEENTDYQVRIFSKNELGFSTSYALGSLRTKNKPPLAPFGLGVVYAKNYRLELVWRRIEGDRPRGYVIQIKREKDPWRYYSPEGLASSQAEAFVIEEDGGSGMSYSITDILENGVSYSLRVLAVDETGTLSAPSSPVYNIVLEDTVPPLPPSDIKYEFVSQDRLRISWETKDRDIAKFRVYYGLNAERWDGIVYTEKRYHDLIVERQKLLSRQLYIAVTAIDRSGNESGYRPVEKQTEVVGGEQTAQDFVLSFENVIKDLSPAVRELPKKVEKKPIKRKAPPKGTAPKEYGMALLARKGYVVENGETVTLGGKILLPEDAIIRVNSGGTLIVDGAELIAEKGIWGGIRYQAGSKGSITNTTVSGALTGIAIIGIQDGVRLNNVVIERCTENGIFVKDSKVEMKVLYVRANKTGVLLQNSEAFIQNSYIEENEKGVLAYNYRCRIEDSLFRNNSTYGLRVYGGGVVKGCTFRNNYVGAAFEQGLGSVELLECMVEKSRVDGIVVTTSDLTIRKTQVSGNGRNGIYVKDRTNPVITSSDITNNKKYAVYGGGKVTRCYVAYNNGSTYIDDTQGRGKPDDIASSSSSGSVKQIFNVDYIGELSGLSVLQ
jgi:parallel beta-helix repeat protein